MKVFVVVEGNSYNEIFHNVHATRESAEAYIKNNENFYDEGSLHIHEAPLLEMNNA